MKAIVTGSSGFVGRHMVRALEADGYEVEPWDLARGGADAHYLFNMPNHRTGRADLLVHAAASQPHRAAIDGDPMHMVRNLHLDAAAFAWAVRTDTRMLYLSSAAAYPAQLQTKRSHQRLREQDIGTPVPNPADGYGWTKLTGEKMAAAASHHIPVHVVRPFSGYGQDQDDRFPFGAFAIRALCHDDPFTIWGRGDQVRDWIHIDDVVAGALAVVKADFRPPVNLCTGVGTSMREVAAMMCQQAGYMPQFSFKLDAPPGVAYRVGDPALMYTFHTPKVDLAEGVRRAITGGTQ